MAELKLRIPDELKEDIEKHSNIAWSKVFEDAAREKLDERVKRKQILAELDNLLRDSQLSEKDALRLGLKVNEGVHKRLKRQGAV